MGRRRGFFAVAIAEMEKSARRSASEGRRNAQRASGVRVRALEREMVREERARERARVADERATAREDAIQEREARARRKEEEKENQLAEWREEIEAYAERDVLALALASEGPEVEDREALFSELLVPRAFVAEDFTPPTRVPPAVSASIRARVDADATKELATFGLPPVGTLNAVQVAVAAVAALGGVVSALPHSPSLVLWFSAGMGVAWLLLEATRRRMADKAHALHVARVSSAAEESVKAELKRAMADAVAAALREHEDEQSEAARRHEEQQRERHAHLRALLAGSRREMGEELGQVIPLEESLPLSVDAQVVSASSVSLQLDAELNAVLQPKRATLLASGKPSYKPKTQKLLREEATRFIAGAAIRCASEAMLHLPTVMTAVVVVRLVALDASRGLPGRQPVLSVEIPFAALAPLQMPDLDPVAALEYFKHSWTSSVIDAEVKRMVAQ